MLVGASTGWQISQGAAICQKVGPIAILCPVHRSKIKANKKEQFTACGEESTYGHILRCQLQTQCQSVPHFSIREAQDLAKSTVHSPTRCARRLGAALWGRQRAAFLERVLDDWKVSTIFDCSPGSGALMEAALTRGVVYHGLCPMLSVFLALLVL